MGTAPSLSACRPTGTTIGGWSASSSSVTCKLGPPEDRRSRTAFATRWARASSCACRGPLGTSRSASAAPPALLSIRLRTCSEHTECLVGHGQPNFRSSRKVACSQVSYSESGDLVEHLAPLNLEVARPKPSFNTIVTRACANWHPKYALQMPLRSQFTWVATEALCVPMPLRRSR